MPEMIDPVIEANPDLEIETATFDSNEEAAAKLAGGFEADVVEICLDEMTAAGRPGAAAAARPGGDRRTGTTSTSPTPRASCIDGQAYGVPLSAGLEGLVYNSEEVPGGIDQLADLFDPQFAGRATIQGSYALLAIAEAALAIGIEDPMNMGAERARAREAVPDRPRRPVPHAVGLGLGPGQPVQVGRGRGRRGRAAARAADASTRGVPAKWSPRQGGDAVVGLRLRDHLEGAEHPRRLRADELAVVARGAGDPGRDGYLVTNRKAIELAPTGLSRSAPGSRRRRRDPRDLSARTTRTGCARSRSSSLSKRSKGSSNEQRSPADRR